ncbi:hypothetical protein TWF718_000171 [Orbilia javanica]|uniref:Uncharacterized protein n=1 Tax=Orbilia javanica TaxID=47235 RepID=A0AAN8NED0_9PEZI
MKVYSTIAFGLIAFSIPTLAAPAPPASSPTEASTNDYRMGPMVPMQFRGSTVEGGPDMELHGTAEQVITHLNKVHPGWEEEMESLDAIQKGALKARGWAGPPICFNTPGSDARAHIILGDGVSHLRRLGNQLCGTPANSCSRVSCSWYSAIYLCSDRNDPVGVPCNRIADAAESIANVCQKPGLWWQPARGHLSDTDGYTIVVRGDGC